MRRPGASMIADAIDECGLVAPSDHGVDHAVGAAIIEFGLGESRAD